LEHVNYKRLKRARFAVPAAVVAAIAGAALVPALSGASSPPSLPVQSAQQLLVDVSRASPPQLSGSLMWTANLGLSDLSSLENELGQGASGASASASSGSGANTGFDPLSLLSGSHQIDVWLGGATAEHLALIEPQAEEVDLIRNSDGVWLWDSATQTAAHLVGLGGDAATVPNRPVPTAAPMTPQQWAAQLLSHISPTTSVTVGGAVYVAGQPAYQLLVAPKGATGSTIDHIEIDLGAAGPLSGVPLRVAVYSAGQASPALELGFTGQVNLGAPPASEFTFTPPPGAKVVTDEFSGTAKVGSAGTTSGMPPTVGLKSIGSGWATVLNGAGPQFAGAASQGELAAASSVVQVGGRQARLFGTNLLNVLIMPDGHFYAGLVTPRVLEAAASSGS